MGPHLRWPSGVVLAAGAGLLARVVYVLATRHFRPVGDNWGYLMRAEYLQAHGHLWPITYNGRTHPDAYWPPVFPATLAALLELRSIATHLWLGRHVGLVTWVRLGMSVIGACSILGLGLIADRLFGRRVALAAAWTAALSVPIIDVGAALYSESLLVPLMIGATAATIEYRRTRRPWLLVAAGVMTGLCALTHSDGIVLVLPLGLALWPRGRPSREALVPVAALLAGMVLVIFPWTVRNAAKFDAFVPLSTSLGNTMAGTYNSVSASMSPPGIWLIPSKRREYKPIFRAHPVNGPAQDTALIHRALHYIGHTPATYPTSPSATRSISSSSCSSNARRPRSGRRTNRSGPSTCRRGCFWLLCLAAVAGCFTRAARAAPRWLWLIPGLMYLAVLFMGADTSRFRSPIDPFLILLAACAIDAVAGRYRTHATPAGD